MPNRLKGRPLINAKELPERGDSHLGVDASSNTSVLKWHNNKIVILTSNFVGLEPIATFQRYSKTGKRRVEVSQPAIAKEYSKFTTIYAKFEVLYSDF